MEHNQFYFVGDIRTNLYGADAWQFIQTMICEIGEQDQIFGRAGHSAYYMHAHLDNTNEVIITVTPPVGYYDRDHRHTIFRKATDARGVLKEFAHLIRRYMYNKIERDYQNPINSDKTLREYINSKWNHTNNDVADYLCSKFKADNYYMRRLYESQLTRGHRRFNSNFKITVAEINYIYTLFRDYRRNHEHKFSEKIVKRFTTDHYNPMMTEMETLRRKEYSRIYDEYEKKIIDQTPERQSNVDIQSSAFNKLQKLICEFKLQQEEVIKQLISERDAKLAELNVDLLVANY
jgi:hypothetical protein